MSKSHKQIIHERSKKNVMGGIIFNVFSTFLCLMVIFFSAMPSYSGSIETMYADLDKDLTKQNDLKENGFSSNAELKKALNSYAKDKSGIELLFVDATKLQQAYTKPAGAPGEYLVWLDQELLAVDETSDDTAQNLQIIGNIVPGYGYGQDNEFFSLGSQEWFKISSNKYRITLAKFIKHIEQNFLKKYNLSSDSGIGIDNIEFDKSVIIGSNIGTFTVELELTGENQDFIDFLNDIQTSGRIKVNSGRIEMVKKDEKAHDELDDLDSEFFEDFENELSQDFKDLDTEDEAAWDNSSTSKLDNLLVTVDSFSLNDFPIKIDGEWVGKNEGSVVLRFYVKGISAQDYVFLDQGIVKKRQDLFLQIEEQKNRCIVAQEQICDTTDGAIALAALRTLEVQLKDIKTPGEQTNGKIDVEKQLEELIAIYSILRYVETRIARSKYVFDNGRFPDDVVTEAKVDTLSLDDEDSDEDLDSDEDTKNKKKNKNKNKNTRKNLKNTWKSKEKEEEEESDDE